MLARLFVDHPSSVGETYFQHMRMALGFGWALLKASGACFVHALVPALCVRTGSGIIRDLHGRMVLNRTGQSAPQPTTSEDAMLWLASNI